MRLQVKRMIVFEGEGSLKAFCDLAIEDSFLLRGIRIVEGKDGLFVSMPRQQAKSQKWFDSVVVLTQEAKTAVKEIILNEYNKVKAVDLIDE